MTRILAIDTATGPCSVAVWDRNRIVAYVENSKPVMQSASLMPMVEEALQKSDMEYRDLTAITSTTGPGSFTGIRVGLAAASGIAFAAGIKGMGFTTLEVLAFAARHHAPNYQGGLLALLNAGKGEYYYQYYTSAPLRQPAFEARLGSMEQIMAETPRPALVIGNSPITADGFTSCDVTFPRADALAELAATAATGQALRPFYIRAPDAKLPAAKL